MLISNIPQTWEFVAYVRKEVSHYFGGKISDEIMESIVMSASELTENAIKFGVDVNDGKKANIEFDLVDNELYLQVTSGFKDHANVDKVTQLIDRINQSDDLEAIYYDRLKEILETSNVDVTGYDEKYKGKNEERNL